MIARHCIRFYVTAVRNSVLTMTTVPTMNFIYVVDFANYTVFENHNLVVGK